MNTFNTAQDKHVTFNDNIEVHKIASNSQQQNYPQQQQNYPQQQNYSQDRGLSYQEPYSHHRHHHHKHHRNNGNNNGNSNGADVSRVKYSDPNQSAVEKIKDWAYEHRVFLMKGLASAVISVMISNYFTKNKALSKTSIITFIGSVVAFVLVELLYDTFIKVN